MPWFKFGPFFFTLEFSKHVNESHDAREVPVPLNFIAYAKRFVVTGVREHNLKVKNRSFEVWTKITLAD